MKCRNRQFIKFISLLKFPGLQYTLRRHPPGSENQIKKINELARMVIEPKAFGLALRRSNDWATETPHQKHPIQLRYRRTADNVAVAWLCPLSNVCHSLVRAVNFVFLNLIFTASRVSASLSLILTLPALSPF